MNSLTVDNFTDVKRTTVVAVSLLHELIGSPAGIGSFDEMVEVASAKHIAKLVASLTSSVSSEEVALAAPDSFAQLGKIRTKDGTAIARKKLLAWFDAEYEADRAIEKLWIEAKQAKQRAAAVERDPVATAKKGPKQRAGSPAPIVQTEVQLDAVEQGMRDAAQREQDDRIGEDTFPVDGTPAAQGEHAASVDDIVEPEPRVLVNDATAPEGIDPVAWQRQSPSGRRRLIAKLEKRRQKDQQRAAKQSAREAASAAKGAKPKREPLVTPELKAMKISYLREKYRELYGKSTGASHRIVLYHVATALRNIAQGLPVDAHITKWKQTATTKKVADPVVFKATAMKKLAAMRSQLAAIGTVIDAPAVKRAVAAIADVEGLVAKHTAQKEAA